MSKNILLCTLGASWAVIPEAYAFLAPQHLPLYQHHPHYAELLNLKHQHQLEAPDEIWVCTTQGEQTQASLQHLQNWLTHCPKAPLLRIWQAQQTNQLANQQECAKIKELIVRACLKAHHEAAGGQVTLSLAGGRKTMSADMQWAGSLFGCQALLHVISADQLPQELFRPKPELLAQALPKEYANTITPLIAGKAQRSDLLDIYVDNVAPIHTESYPLNLPPNTHTEYFSGAQTLTQELNKREQDSSRLFGNYLLTISREEQHENWRSLYRLPPRYIEQLRTSKLNDNHRTWLTSLPKADLHRHLGGCLSLAAQQHVAQAIWESLTSTQQQQAQQQCQHLLKQTHWAWDWPTHLKTHGERSHNSAYVLLNASAEQLQTNLWDATAPRVALKEQHPQGFSAYERPGELTGSALLTHPAALQAYTDALVQQTQQEGLSYLELRGSPQKYSTDGMDFIARLQAAITHSLNSITAPQRPTIRFIIIADRRADHRQLQATINLAVTAKINWPEFVVGLDMAGDEQYRQPESIAHLFTPAFEYCLPITIHAGEGEAAESIWQAAYHLHADRIGHGLTINDNNNLAQRFRDRNICLELCPSSNREVVGYQDPHYPDTQHAAPYPLMALWEKGIPLSLCTDNPGISKTTLTEEYLTAARMVGNKLTQWDALAMMKQGFVHSFLSSAEKQELIKQVDARLFQLLTETIL